MMIQVNKIGHVRRGDDAERFVKVQELADSPSSFLILMALDRHFKEGCGDYWVEDYAALEQFFQESGWVVEWLD
jgi:hypothetical protein